MFLVFKAKDLKAHKNLTFSYLLVLFVDRVRLSVPQSNISKCDIQLDNVFVASQWWGTETGHFTGETLPRIVPYLDLARTMPIHVWGENELSGQIKTWFHYLNLTAVQGDNVCASNVYVSLKCIFVVVKRLALNSTLCQPLYLLIGPPFRWHLQQTAAAERKCATAATIVI